MDFQGMILSDSQLLKNQTTWQNVLLRGDQRWCYTWSYPSSWKGTTVNNWMNLRFFFFFFSVHQKLSRIIKLFYEILRKYPYSTIHTYIKFAFFSDSNRREVTSGSHSVVNVRRIQFSCQIFHHFCIFLHPWFEWDL